jgi:hypothetical protein
MSFVGNNSNADLDYETSVAKRTSAPASYNDPTRSAKRWRLYESALTIL